MEYELNWEPGRGSNNWVSEKALMAWVYQHHLLKRYRSDLWDMLLYMDGGNLGKVGIPKYLCS